MKGRKKGTQKTGGRQLGTPNKITSSTRQLIQDIIDKNLNTLNDDIKKLSPKDRINAITGLLPYIVPKQQATIASVAIERLDDEQLNELAEQILNGMNDEDNIE
mgnify:CR=1 FL=1